MTSQTEPLSPVPALLEQLALRTPTAVAIETASVEVTYAQLWERSGSVAASLRNLSEFRAGGLLGVLYPRGAEGIIVQLGIWRAGCAYVPLDPRLPGGRLEAILTDARPLAVLAPTGEGAAVATSVPVHHPDVSRVAGLGSDEAFTTCAYVIYTSGSTGTPKGVEVGHSSLANLVGWHQRTYDTKPGIRVGAFAGLAFDATVWDVWATLSSGATLVLPEDRTTTDVLTIRDFLTSRRIDHCFLSTPLAEQLITLPDPPATLQLLNTGGDRLRVHPPIDFPAAVHNHYGPTEATVVTTASEDLRKGDCGSFPNIGRPISGATVRLVDATGAEITEPGEGGELWIGGAVLALGYWRDDGLTRDRFQRTEDCSLWYRSGDICRWDRRGWLEYVERRDTQVNLRGHRIELAEIEQMLLSLPGVKQAAVVVRGDQFGGSLVALVCGDADGGYLRAELSRSLPTYMVPGVFRYVDELPLNSSAKIDRAALAQVVATDTKITSQAGEEPLDEPASTLDAVAGIWGALLGQTPAQSDDFFKIGGHSLVAARVTGRVREAFGIQIALQEIFGNPVLSDYARRVDELRVGGQ
ncbi:amino acid adenylation domain-containing protein [Streptomyces umbrinus]|uniref:Amino acid adenylation domain-containing protein n=1 Tax=Streptomyces umbrinus TaxID=67370 RepID=A0ABU0SPT1_9ACTN|nr:non-ribosomal peptide synthetase [Streptomyces umbrinus]MDQ1024731.1 amino acid adenylation domain-containing protein [Streptomyces umbrinus]